MKKLISLSACAVLAVGQVLAQPLPPPPPNQAISLDVIVAILVLSGMIYGVVRLMNRPAKASASGL